MNLGNTTRSNVICPQCGESRLHRSRRRSIPERLLSLAGVAMRRCHACDSRFAAFGRSLVRIEDLRGFGRCLAMAAGLVLGAAVVLAAILWMNRIQATQENQSLVPRNPSCQAWLT